MFAEGHAHNFAVPDPFEAAALAEGGSGSMRAPMPGLVKIVRAARRRRGQGPGAAGAGGDEDGSTPSPRRMRVIAEIVPEGAQVLDGAVLVRFEEAG